MTNEEIGRRAVVMHRAKLQVEAWMKRQGELGNLVEAGQCPDWADYHASQIEFQAALNEAVAER